MEKLCELCKYRLMGMWGLIGHVLKIGSFNKSLLERIENYRDERDKQREIIINQKVTIYRLEEEIKRHTGKL